MPAPTLKDAVKTSTAYFSELLPAQDIRLEEVELSEDERIWKITLSGLVPLQSTSGLALSAIAEAMSPKFERLYKVFIVDAATGAVRSMKMR
jgi:hypothetical protein